MDTKKCGAPGGLAADWALVVQHGDDAGRRRPAAALERAHARPWPHTGVAPFQQPLHVPSKISRFVVVVVVIDLGLFASQFASTDQTFSIHSAFFGSPSPYLLFGDAKGSSSFHNRVAILDSVVLKNEIKILIKW